MTTSLRKKLGAYEIRSKIGEGGMGEVCRAYDEKLKSLNPVKKTE